MSRLAELTVKRTQATEKGLRDLQRALPKCRINYGVEHLINQNHNGRER
jgi:hypothetical protein